VQLSGTLSLLSVAVNNDTKSVQNMWPCLPLIYGDLTWLTYSLPVMAVTIQVSTSFQYQQWIMLSQLVVIKCTACYKNVYNTLFTVYHNRNQVLTCWLLPFFFFFLLFLTNGAFRGFTRLWQTPHNMADKLIICVHNTIQSDRVQFYFLQATSSIMLEIQHNDLLPKEKSFIKSELVDVTVIHS